MSRTREQASKEFASTSIDSSYLIWKNWNRESFGVLKKSERGYFDAEIQKTRINKEIKKIKLLEIGFGQGKFLAYARSRGWDTVGTEINESLVEVAQENGYSVVLTEDLKPFSDNCFDMVVAFDVFEHLQQDSLIKLIGDIKRILIDGGVLMARFPNGDSPFGLIHQNGDLTHVNAIGSGKIRFIASQLSLKILHMGGAAEPIWGLGCYHFFHRITVLPLKFIINNFVRFVFLPNTQVPFCASNITIILGVQKS